MRITPFHIIWLKAVIHLAALIPISLTYFKAFSDKLGADPVQEILHFTGIGAFNLLLLSLLVSPLARYSKQGQLINVRRLVGLYAFTYALTHFVSYLLFELQLEWSLLLSEIIKRPYITVGFSALIILTLLTVTSTKAIQRKMGRNWQKLHNWIYAAGLLVALHYIWSVKSELLQPLAYWAMLILLLAARRDKLLRRVKKTLQNYKNRKHRQKKLA